MLNLNKLQLLLILCKICLNQDSHSLQIFVKHCSVKFKDTEFVQIIYTAMKILIQYKCGSTPCEDWLVSHLYKIYRSV